MTRYVLGFAFDGAGENVVLIKKTKPAWQAGKYNGLGGKVEPFEADAAAMAREFKEESGVDTTDVEWTAFGSLAGPDWQVSLFYIFNDNVFKLARTTTEELIRWFSTSERSPNRSRGDLSTAPLISNVPWLIAAARNHRANGGEFTLEVRYV